MKKNFQDRIIVSISVNELDDVFEEVQKSLLSDEDKAELYGMMFVMKRTITILETIQLYILPLPDDNYIRSKIIKSINAFKKGEPL